MTKEDLIKSISESIKNLQLASNAIKKELGSDTWIQVAILDAKKLLREYKKNLQLWNK